MLEYKYDKKSQKETMQRYFKVEQIFAVLKWRVL